MLSLALHDCWIPNTNQQNERKASKQDDMPSEAKLALEAGQNATVDAKGRDIVSSVVLVHGTSCVVLGF